MNYFTSGKNRVNEKNKSLIARQLWHASSYLDGKDIIYCNMKAENVLFRTD